MISEIDFVKKLAKCLVTFCEEAPDVNDKEREIATHFCAQFIAKNMEEAAQQSKQQVSPTNKPQIVA